MFYVPLLPKPHIQGPASLQACTPQIDVVTNQIEIASDVQAHVAGTAHAVAACAAGEVDVAVAGGQSQVAVDADLAPGERPAAGGNGIDGDVTLPLNDGQVGCTH